jgi:hypothetical protein
MFAYKLLLCEFVMLFFFAIRINVENDLKNVYNFKFAIIFLFFKTIIFYSWKNVFDSMNFVTMNMKISQVVCNVSAKYNLILIQCVKSIFYSYFAVRDLRDVFMIFTCVLFFYACRWCWNRNRSCDVFSRIYCI